MMDTTQNPAVLTPAVLTPAVRAQLAKLNCVVRTLRGMGIRAHDQVAGAALASPWVFLGDVNSYTMSKLRPSLDCETTRDGEATTATFLGVRLYYHASEAALAPSETARARFRQWVQRTARDL